MQASLLEGVGEEATGSRWPALDSSMMGAGFPLEEMTLMWACRLQHATAVSPDLGQGRKEQHWTGASNARVRV